MKAEMSVGRVSGFLDTNGRKIVNGKGEAILLTGWGLGNWLLCEGYMWLSRGAERFDRPRRIEAVVEELCGREYANAFWPRFLKSYITEKDIALMAQMGYNSLRIPINARLFMEEGPGIKFIETGFSLLDQCLDWCEKHSLYAFIDLHGAPGGQTGANIDDCVDDVARLFVDQHCFLKGVALWERLAQRYKDRWIVGGYDLLNEPLRPVRFPGDPDQDGLLPRLKAFYQAAIAAIRQTDKRHLITLEGHHWATGLDVFDKKYDDKMVLHFHRYGTPPDMDCLRPYLQAAERLDCPLWLGESGESVPEWFTALFPLAGELDIGYNLWPWKKMACINSPLSITAPENWDKLIAYAHGGPHPGYAAAQKALDQYLENMLADNCRVNESLAAHVFRLPGCTIRGTDFDELPGVGVSYLGLSGRPEMPYRRGTGMEIIEKFPDAVEPIGFDSRWKRFVLGLSPGEFACYTLYDITVQARLEIGCYAKETSTLLVYQDEALLGSFTLGGLDDLQVIGSVRMNAAARARIRLEVEKGHVQVEAIMTVRSKNVNL